MDYTDTSRTSVQVFTNNFNCELDGLHGWFRSDGYRNVSTPFQPACLPEAFRQAPQPSLNHRSTTENFANCSFAN